MRENTDFINAFCKAMAQMFKTSEKFPDLHETSQVIRILSVEVNFPSGMYGSMYRAKLTLSSGHFIQTKRVQRFEAALSELTALVALHVLEDKNEVQVDSQTAKSYDQLLQKRVDDAIHECMSTSDGAHHKQYTIDQTLRHLLAEEYESCIKTFEEENMLEWDCGIVG